MICNTLHCSWVKNVLFKGMFSNIGSDQLDKLVCQVYNDHPNFGIRMIKGKLQSEGCHVQRDRIRSSLIWIDPIGLMQRWQKAIKPRSYNVKFPRSLRHMATTNSLLRRINVFLPFKSHILFYNSLVLPIFDYADMVWGDKNKNTVMATLQVSQSKAAKIIFDRPFHLSLTEALALLK